MAQTLSIYVMVPGIAERHNFVVPKEMSVGRMIPLITKILKEEYPGIDDVSQSHALLRREDAQVLNPGLSLYQLGVVNGQELILV